MKPQPSPADEIQSHVEALAQHDDEELLRVAASLPPLADESESVWLEPVYWSNVAYLFVALGDIAAQRKLRALAPILLDAASFGDPGEIMRGLRHQLEAIFDPEWEALADLAIQKASFHRPGTRLWAIDQLVILDDPRARPIFESALSDSSAIASLAAIGIRRLDNLANRA